jgi:hypothetical protein
MVIQNVAETFSTFRFVLEFCRYSRSDKAKTSDLALSNFIMLNLAKGIAVNNCLLGLFYFARFKNYRNSYLLLFHIPATYFGIKNGLKGTTPVLESYLYSHDEVPCSVFEDQTYSEKTRRALSTGERSLIE